MVQCLICSKHHIFLSKGMCHTLTPSYHSIQCINFLNRCKYDWHKASCSLYRIYFTGLLVELTSFLLWHFVLSCHCKNKISWGQLWSFNLMVPVMVQKPIHHNLFIEYGFCKSYIVWRCYKIQDIGHT